MKSILKLFILLICLNVSSVYASKVDTVLTYSPSMKKNIKAVVITPDNYPTADKMPVLYLLHGYSGKYDNWTKHMPNINYLADQYHFIVVCPDGNYGSWYFDSPIDSTFKYETYVAGELIQWIDKNYKTANNRNGRAITGLSMGGHGAMYLAFRHQDVFGACGSMSGGVDIRPFPNNWDLAKRLGEQRTHPENWENNTVINLLHLLTPKNLKIIFDCGTEDFFYPVNVRLHEELTYRNIPHDFISRPGQHNGEYWNNAVKYQAQYFSDFFKLTSNK